MRREKNQGSYERESAIFENLQSYGRGSASLSEPPGVFLWENSQGVINYIYSENIYYKIYITLARTPILATITNQTEVGHT